MYGTVTQVMVTSTTTTLIMPIVVRPISDAVSEKSTHSDDMITGNQKELASRSLKKKTNTNYMMYLTF